MYSQAFVGLGVKFRHIARLEGVHQITLNQEVLHSFKTENVVNGEYHGSRAY